MKAKDILEETFDIVISTKGPYHLQMGGADQSGDLGNRVKINTVIWRLCELVDQMQEHIQILSSRLVEIDSPRGQTTPPGTPQ